MNREPLVKMIAEKTGANYRTHCTAAIGGCGVGSVTVKTIEDPFKPGPLVISHTIDCGTLSICPMRDDQVRQAMFERSCEEAIGQFYGVQIDAGRRQELRLPQN